MLSSLNTTPSSFPPSLTKNPYKTLPSVSHGLGHGHGHGHGHGLVSPSSIHEYQRLTSPAVSRRLMFSSVSGIWDALTSGNNTREASLAIRRGMTLFREGDVPGSVMEFDKAVKLDSRQKAYLWQRGLSLYYLDRFAEGAEQFRLDVAQNPNDTEESIWCFLCEAQLYGVDKARSQFLKLVSEFKNGLEREYFYASLYAGLYYESQGNTEAAKLHMLSASQSAYGSRSDDYMAALAKVHCLYRKWSSSSLSLS